VPLPHKILQPKTINFSARFFGQLRDLIMNISGRRYFQ